MTIVDAEVDLWSAATPEQLWPLRERLMRLGSSLGTLSISQPTPVHPTRRGRLWIPACVLEHRPDMPLL